ncbi:O-antigen acetylase [Oceaniferula spumae]|uniref:O-antigen acetylase n=1 Tax=Oceaniferula spumae TaxID=2979115 RepID=A0AAT9FQG1_9BACT
MSSTPTHSLSYRPDIDGLRSLAVIPVILFHAGLGFPGGYVGVDIFFVISGFLITSIIAKDIRNDCFSMTHFWERRVRRILPASVLVLLVTLIAGAFILLPGQFEDLGKAACAQALMVSNFYFWQQDGYFATASEFLPTLHTWSLAVEEQFYLILPLLMVWLMRGNSGRVARALKVLSLIFVISLAWSVYNLEHHPSSTFFLLPTRAWELLAGSLLALVPLKKPLSSKWNELLSIAGVLLILGSVFFMTSETPFPGLAAIPPCLGAVLLIFSNQSMLTTAGKLLALKPCVFVGKISYSLYLWHWPLLVYGRHLSVSEPSLTLRLSLVLASFILAYLTWKYVENPFRTKSICRNRKQIARFGVVGTLLPILIGTGIYQAEGIPSRLSPEAQVYAQAAEAKMLNRTESVVTSGKLPTILPVSSDQTQLPVLFWGDSHCRSLAPLMRSLAERHRVNFHYSVRDAHPAILGVDVDPERRNVKRYNKAVFQFIEKNQIKHVILVCRWAAYARTSRGTHGMSDPDAPGKPSTEVFKARFSATIDTLTKAGVTVWILKQVPVQPRNPPELLVHAVQFNRDITTMGVTLEEHTKNQSFVNGVIDSTASKNCHVIDPLPVFLTENNLCRIALDGQSLYRDRDHLSGFGSLQLQPLFDPIFEKFSKTYRKPAP